MQSPITVSTLLMCVPTGSRSHLRVRTTMRSIKHDHVVDRSNTDVEGSDTAAERRESKPEIAPPDKPRPKLDIRPSTCNDDPQHLITYGRHKQARIQATVTNWRRLARTKLASWITSEPSIGHSNTFNSQAAMASEAQTIIGYELLQLCSITPHLPLLGSNISHTTGSSGRGRTRSAMAPRQRTSSAHTHAVRQRLAHAPRQ